MQYPMDVNTLSRISARRSGPWRGPAPKSAPTAATTTRCTAFEDASRSRTGAFICTTPAAIVLRWTPDPHEGEYVWAFPFL